MRLFFWGLYERQKEIIQNMKNKTQMLKVFVGYDEREAIAYHAFCNSVLTQSTQPVSFIPLALNTLKYKETHTDGSNAFIYSRFLVPHLCEYQGWAVFCDGDMICKEDISKLFECADESKAVMVVKHNYKTKYPVKYLGYKNEDYPRKNWSSVILWNCSHEKNKILTPEYIETHSGSHLHRFEWLDDNDIGELRLSWNWLAMEYSAHNVNPKIIHYTIGTPCFEPYAYTDLSEHWHEEFKKTIAPIKLSE